MIDPIDAKILEARKEFIDLEADPTMYRSHWIKQCEDQIIGLLSEAGVDAAALDETGQSTKEEMESRIKQAVSKGCVLHARQIVSDLQNSTDAIGLYDINHKIEKMRGLLSDAGVDATALDETGQSTIEEMEDRIEQAVKRMSKVSAEQRMIDLENHTEENPSGTVSFRELNAEIKMIRGLFERASGPDSNSMTGIEGEINQTVAKPKILQNLDGLR